MKFDKEVLLEIILSTPSGLLDRDYFMDVTEGFTKDNWFNVLEKSIRLRTYLTLFKNLEFVGYEIPDEASLVRTHWAKVKSIYNNEVVKTLECLNYRYSFLKSFNLFSFLSTDYENLRFFSDIDLLIDTENVEKTRQFFISQGFFHAEIEGDSLMPCKPDKLKEQKHYELHPLYKAFPLDLDTQELQTLQMFRFPVKKHENINSTIIKIDIHENISNELCPSTIWRDCCFNQEYNRWLFKPEDLAWYLLLKLYYETHADDAPHAQRRFRNLVDVLVLLEEESLNFDWDYFSRKVLLHNIEAPAFYVLSTLSQIYKKNYLEMCSKKIIENLVTPKSRTKDYGPFILKLLNLPSQNDISFSTQYR